LLFNRESPSTTRKPEHKEELRKSPNQGWELQTRMKVFVSSLISGMEPLRAATRDAITTLRHEPVMAEDFGASPNSPQITCLSSLRDADVVVLILGQGYGAVQASGLSATHEEYNEAKGRKSVFAFVQEGVELEAKEADFVREVQGWESGLFRSSFRTAEDLRKAVTRALYDHAIANVTGPVDQDEMAQRAAALLPTDRRGHSSGAASLNLAVAGGPRQSILRPVEIEKGALADALAQRALFGDHRLFDLALGIQQGMDGAVLTISQERGGKVTLNEQGSICVSLPIERSERMMPEIIYEVVQDQFAGALDYASWVLDFIDQTQRLTHVAIAASMIGADHMAWRTQLESLANPNSMSLGMRNSEHAPVQTSQTRAALRLNVAHIVEDLVVPLRRQWR
jgi:hypothetical protein